MVNDRTEQNSILCVHLLPFSLSDQHSTTLSEHAITSSPKNIIPSGNNVRGSASEAPFLK
uniref:Uncharacterized protein n=1 Tax=Rhizophora mucronata TaxID=61149 RepID=A0A2P2Q0E2_RHIMU